MAKAKATRPPTSGKTTTARVPRKTQAGSRESDPLVGAATRVGTTLGHLAGRIEALDQQRAQLIADLRQAVARGQDLLNRLGRAAGNAASSADSGETSEATDSHSVLPPTVAAMPHRAEPTARHDASVRAKAQHAVERIRPRTSFRSQNR